MPDQAPVVLVTGASRGAGRGIAIALGAHGCTVYVTGRSKASGDHPLPGTIYETADAVTKAGGKGIAVACDHGKDEEVAALFAQIDAEQGRLDILVNNAAAVHDELTQPGNFWEKPLKLADMIDVGIRSSYVASWYAAPIMTKQDKALIVFTSASGSVHYSLGAAYGAHKASLDKMAHDMAVDFADAKSQVATVSIWMGAVLTERLKMVIASDREKFRHARGHLGESRLHWRPCLGLVQRPGPARKVGQDLHRCRAGARIWHHRPGPPAPVLSRLPRCRAFRLSSHGH